MQLVRGSGNVYRDLGRPNADLEQARAIVAAKIIRILDQRKLSKREAEKLTGISHSEFSRIRVTQLRRFTLDRLIAILGELDAEVEVELRNDAGGGKRSPKRIELVCASCKVKLA